MGKGRRRLWLLVGHGAVGLATAGAFLPILPTVPFLLVAGWAYARGNPELRERMRNDPRFGRAVREWQDRGAIPVKAKVMAVGGMSSSFAVLALSSPGYTVLAGTGLVMAGAAAYVVSRPTPSDVIAHGAGEMGCAGSRNMSRRRDGAPAALPPE